MPDTDPSSSAGDSMGLPSRRSNITHRSNYQNPKPRIRVIGGVALALGGGAILAYSTQYFLFHPMTATDEYIGLRMWIVGSWLLGAGFTLTIARPWVAALVGFFAPALTFGIAMLLYFVLLLLAPTWPQ